MNHPKDILKNARKSRELTLRELAKKLGVPLTTINSWERGAAFPNAKNRKKIEETLKIPADSLVDPEITGALSPSIMADYETRPVMMHKSHWALAESLLKTHAAPNESHLFATLLSNESRKK